MVALNSKYWGQTMTVTGLLTGQDILEVLEGQNLGDGILLPSVMLKHGEAVFLDDLRVEELAQCLNTKIWMVQDVDALIQTCKSAIDTLAIRGSQEAMLHS
jgi:NifB/MoaA-like Fe-S oxidoreductase